MNVAMVTPFPSEGKIHEEGVPATASYSKQLVEGLSRGVDGLVVFSSTSSYEKEHYRNEKSWSSNLFFAFQVFLSILASSQDFDVVHIQHEFFHNGGFLHAAIFPILPLLLRVSGRNCVITLHNGVISRRELDSEFCRSNRLPDVPVFWRFGLGIYFKTISLLSSRLVVHEDKFKNILVEGYGVSRSRVAVVNLGVVDRPAEQNGSVEGELKILFFGHIAPRKSLKKLFELDERLDENYEIVIAGGKPPTRTDRFESYYENVRSEAEEKSNMKFTGFIEESNIPDYFQKSDILVLPYENLYSTSFPLHIALSYGTLIAGSGAFRGILPDNLVFSDIEDLSSMMLRLKQDPDYLKSLESAVFSMRDSRTWEQVVEDTLEVYFSLS